MTTERQAAEAAAPAHRQRARRRRKEPLPAEIERFLAAQMAETHAMTMGCFGALARMGAADSPLLQHYVLDAWRLARLNLRLLKSMERICAQQENRKAAAQLRGRIEAMLVAAVTKGRGPA